MEKERRRNVPYNKNQALEGADGKYAKERETEINKQTEEVTRADRTDCPTLLVRESKPSRMCFDAEEKKEKEEEETEERGSRGYLICASVYQYIF